jgi:hypothetical protein
MKNIFLNEERVLTFISYIYQKNVYLHELYVLQEEHIFT